MFIKQRQESKIELNLLMGSMLLSFTSLINAAKVKVVRFQRLVLLQVCGGEFPELCQPIVEGGER